MKSGPCPTSVTAARDVWDCGCRATQLLGSQVAEIHGNPWTYGNPRIAATSPVTTQSIGTNLAEILFIPIPSYSIYFWDMIIESWQSFQEQRLATTSCVQAVIVFLQQCIYCHLSSQPAWKKTNHDETTNHNRKKMCILQYLCICISTHPYWIPLRILFVYFGIRWPEQGEKSMKSAGSKWKSVGFKWRSPGWQTWYIISLVIWCDLFVLVVVCLSLSRFELYHRTKKAKEKKRKNTINVTKKKLNDIQRRNHVRNNNNNNNNKNKKNNNDNDDNDDNVHAHIHMHRSPRSHSHGRHHDHCFHLDHNGPKAKVQGIHKGLRNGHGTVDVLRHESRAGSQQHGMRW